MSVTVSPIVRSFANPADAKKHGGERVTTVSGVGSVAAGGGPTALIERQLGLGRHVGGGHEDEAAQAVAHAQAGARDQRSPVRSADRDELVGVHVEAVEGAATERQVSEAVAGAD